MATEATVNERLAAITAAGTSIWLDQIRRSMTQGGELERLVREESLRGETSNPAIFEKAIGSSDEYDSSVAKALKQGDRSVADLFEAVAVEDIQNAADVLRPERSKELEAGIDLGLFHEHADASFTYYNSKTSDVILPTPLSPSTGYSYQYANAAKFRNRGLEATFNVRPIQRPDYGWEVGLQWARNRGVVLSLNGPEYIYFGSGVAQVGEEIGAFRTQGYIHCGISDPSLLGGAVGTACAGAPKGAMYLDATGFPIIDISRQLAHGQDVKLLDQLAFEG